MSSTIQGQFRSGAIDPAELWARLARDNGLPDEIDLTSEAMGGLVDDETVSSMRATPMDEMVDAGGVVGAMGGLCDDR